MDRENKLHALSSTPSWKKMGTKFLKHRMGVLDLPFIKRDTWI
jgi:hypothetical protein